MSVAAPTLRTERLILRPPAISDFPAYRQMMMSERSRYIGGPYDAHVAWLCFCHDVACWSLFGHGALMIEIASTAECAGQVGINAGPLFPERELGWFVYDGFEGRGLATEAATALRDWAFETLGLATLVSYCDPQNAASIAVARRLGAALDPQAEVQDTGDLVFRHKPGGQGGGGPGL